MESASIQRSEGQRNKKILPNICWNFVAFTAVCAAPAVANGLNSNITTFNGTVAAYCSLPLGDTNEPLNYVGDDNRFWGSVDFSLTANQPVQLSIGAVTVLNEPQNIVGRYAWARVERPQNPGSNTTLLPGPNDASTGLIGASGAPFAANNQTDTSTDYSLSFLVGTTGRGNDGRHMLLPGSYSYRVTISCLQ